MILQQLINPEVVTYKELIFIVLASSGILTLVFTIISKLFDKTSRAMIMEEIKKIDSKYDEKIVEIEREVNGVRMNYLDRFAEQKSLITTNKAIAESHHSEVMQALVGIKKDIEHLPQVVKNNKY